MNFQHTNNKDLALKLLEWHGGQHTGVYALGSSLLAFATNRNLSGGQFIPEPASVGRALGELESIHNHTNQAECAALITELKRRYTSLPPLDEFTLAHAECALWSSTDDLDVPLNEHYTLADLAPETVGKIKTDCAKFQADNSRDLCIGVSRNAEQGGHDFWLTRNGHGCGFWDGDYWAEDTGERLTEAAKKFKECELYIGDDGRLYLQ